MRRNFFLSSMKLILLGVALGILARYLLGNPVAPTDHSRQFTSPIDRSAVKQVEEDDQVSDFPLTPDWNSDSD